MKASELNCSLLIEESQNSSFLILASDKKAENHAKKGKEGGIPKIEGSGRKEGGEEKKTMVAFLVFISATYLEIR